MKKHYSLLFLFLSFVLAAVAQRDGSVRGRLTDTTAHAPVPDATITVLDAKDSTLVGFARSNAAGAWTVRSLSRGKVYRLLVTHVGYKNISRNFMVNDLTPSQDMGELALAPNSGMLDAVTVEVAPIAIKHDTVEYNAGSFKTKPDAVVEDLLKKLPGVQVEKDGTVKAGGETVKKVLVDGKEFFGNDPKIATKNLPADAVDKVQVFDKKSDQSQFTGFDDGNSQKTMNITIKKDKKHGLFGKAIAGGGADATAGSGHAVETGGLGPANLKDGRYEGRFNINQFDDSRQMAALGMVNNTNQQGFSFQDVLGFSGSPIALSGGKSLNLSSDIPIQGLMGNSQAITRTWAGGLNFNDDWGQKKYANVSGSYFFNRGEDQVEQKDSRRYLTPGNLLTQDQWLTSHKISENQRLSFIDDHRIDSFNSIKVSSTFTYQHSNSTSTTIDSSHSTETGELLNNGSTMSSSAMKGYVWNNTALWRHRFAAKGRTLSANLSLGLNDNTGSGGVSSLNHFYQSGKPLRNDTLNQQYTQPANGQNYAATLVYTEPLSKRALFEFDYNFYRNHSRSDKRTFDADSTGKFTRPNNQLTNDFDNTYTYHREGIQFRYQQPRFNFTVGASLQQAFSDNRYGYLTGDSSIRLTFGSLLPNANFQYNFNNYRNFRLFYNTTTNQPALTQLAPVPDNSDPLNIRLGNPGLKQEYYHMVRANYVAFDPFRKVSFFAMAGLTAIHNKIVNDDEVDSVGVRTSRPVNLDGLYTVNGNLSWGFPVRWLKSNLNLNSRIVYNRNAALSNGTRNNSDNWTVSQGADLNFSYKELLDLTASVKVDYNDVRYSLQPGQNQHYWTSTYGLDGNLYLPDGFSLASDLSYIHRTGLPSGYNSSPLVWNAGLAKQVMNKRATIRCQVFDILRQNTGFSRNTNQNYIDDVAYRVLSRYWLVSFTYNINRFAGKAVRGGMQGPRADIKIMN